ncbi:LysR family transcriptional regulator [Ideonella sp. 4Y16]|uniref:LysR family transcriptional regulator n=1 Tax=Ideonella alba TaxID=2824118 RepID=A0A941BCM8_9BURK|nr:LysR family transcriptional regulator [Ideonella alba]MBQ0932100.1 LysR family transcriptional regulator [Ideonella alba]MBQ0945618.1 LysR family transcriptional regulator [Ideonella alba]
MSSLARPDAFDWTLVRSFLLVLEAGSLTAAARRHGLHQPTLSRHVAELEAQLGAPLFERTGRGVRATPVALAMADAARQMRSASQAVAHAVAAQRESLTGTVRLATSEVAAAYLLPEVLVALQQAEPGIQVELVVSNSLSNLLAREADIAVRMLRPSQSSLVARQLAELPIVPCAHRDYLARHGTPRVPEELPRHRLIGFDQDETILRGFARMGLPLGREAFALRCDNQLAASALLAAGAGIGFAARYVLPLLPGVVPLLPQLAIPPMPCWLAVHRELRGSALVRRVWEHLADGIPRVLAAREAATLA